MKKNLCIALCVLSLLSCTKPQLVNETEEFVLDFSKINTAESYSKAISYKSEEPILFQEAVLQLLRKYVKSDFNSEDLLNQLIVAININGGNDNYNHRQCIGVLLCNKRIPIDVLQSYPRETLLTNPEYYYGAQMDINEISSISYYSVYSLLLRSNYTVLRRVLLQRSVDKKLSPDELILLALCEYRLGMSDNKISMNDYIAALRVMYTDYKFHL